MVASSPERGPVRINHLVAVGKRRRLNLVTTNHVMVRQTNLFCCTLHSGWNRCTFDRLSTLVSRFHLRICIFSTAISPGDLRHLLSFMNIQNCGVSVDCSCNHGQGDEVKHSAQSVWSQIGVKRTFVVDGRFFFLNHLRWKQHFIKFFACSLLFLDQSRGPQGRSAKKRHKRATKYLRAIPPPPYF